MLLLLPERSEACEWCLCTTGRDGVVCGVAERLGLGDAAAQDDNDACDDFKSASAAAASPAAMSASSMIGALLCLLVRRLAVENWYMVPTEPLGPRRMRKQAKRALRSVAGRDSSLDDERNRGTASFFVERVLGLFCSPCQRKTSSLSKLRARAK